MFALLFIDLDHFKRINDTWGHKIGDGLLHQVGDRLTGCLRECDIVGREASQTVGDVATDPRHHTVDRLGGDEFVILLTEIRRVEDAGVVARRINSALSEPFVVEETEVYITASIGISAYPTDGEDVETLLKQADGAMYEAKADGRNSYHFYTVDTQARAFERLNIEANLRKALDTDQFILHYQPKVDIQKGGIVGMEALIRWQHPEFGVVSPADFIPIAEEMGLIIPLAQLSGFAPFETLSH